jgi:hypothetical protein
MWLGRETGHSIPERFAEKTTKYAFRSFYALRHSEKAYF